MPHLQHPDPVAMNVNLKKVDSFKKGQTHVWTDEIENGVRHIYIRCFAYRCKKIFRVGDDKGTVIAKLVINPDGYFNTCLICPYCDNHLFVILEGYERMKGVKTVFGHVQEHS